MKNVTKTATVSKFDQKVLDTPVEFSYSYEELEKGDAIPAKEELDDDDKRSFVNARRNASARAAEQTKALDAAGIKKAELSANPQGQFNLIVKALVAAGNTVEQAETIARVHIPAV